MFQWEYFSPEKILGYKNAFGSGIQNWVWPNRCIRYGSVAKMKEKLFLCQSSLLIYFGATYCLLKRTPPFTKYMRWKDEKDHFVKQRNITLKVRKFRIELSQLGNNFGFLNRFIWYFKLLEPRKNIKILLFLPWTSEPHSLQRSSGCRPALQWSEFECKWTYTYKGEYFNVKI